MERKSEYRINTCEEEIDDDETITMYYLMRGTEIVDYDDDLPKIKRELREYRKLESAEWAAEDEANRPRTPEEEEAARKEAEEEEERERREMEEDEDRETLQPGEEWALVSYAGGDQCPEIVSRHRTREGAERAFRRSNPWLFRPDDENSRLGTRNCGTFDRIEKVEKRRRD